MELNEQTIIKTFNTISSDVLNGANHKRNEFVHRLFQYPAMMVPSAQEPLLEVMSKYLPEKPWIYDPFMGSATSLVTAMKFGYRIYGQDINPLSILISKVKTGPFHDELLEKTLTNILHRISTDSINKIDISFPNIDKWFQEKVQVELSKIRRNIIVEEDLYIRRFLWVSLAETIRLCSNDRTSTFKLHARPKEEIEKREISPIQIFKGLAIRNLNDLKDYKDTLTSKGFIKKHAYIRDIEIHWGDTTNPVSTDNKFDLMFTSPPYGDNHTTVTYGQFSYLPLQWIPTNDICDTIPFDFLKTTQEIDRNSLGGKPIQELELVKQELFLKSNTLKHFYSSFSDEEYRKINKVLFFFNDFKISIENILSSLNDNAFLIWTIGNRHVAGKELNNCKILTELLESYGARLISDLKRDILNKRMPSRNNISQTMKKEEVLIFRK